MQEGSKRLIWIVITSILFVTLIIVYFLIFSPQTSNISSVISLRHKYVGVLSNFREKLGLKETDYCWYFKHPIGVLRTSLDPEHKYVYGFSGKLVSINEIENTITLECSSGKQYKVSLVLEKSDLFTEPGWVTVEQGRNMDIEKPRDRAFFFFEPDLTRSSENDQYYVDGEKYEFVWTESRNLLEIYRSMRRNPDSPINSSDSIVIGLLR